MTEKDALIAVCAHVPFGPVRVGLLCKYFGSARKAWGVGEGELLGAGLSGKLVSGFVEHRKRFVVGDYLERLEKMSIGVVLKGEDGYPVNLRGIDGAPVLLYMKGSGGNGDVNSVAIVGTRKMSLYGREVAEQFGVALAGAGFSVISGLARGVDTVAHKAAVSVGGRTVGVLGCGLDLVYPPENRRLADEIIGVGGALYSEYPLGYPALAMNFAARNRIISGIARVVVVVEGMRKSGTLLTASMAAEQGRDVYAVPGQINSPMSEAPLYLLRNGAKVASSPDDVLEDLGAGEVDSGVIDGSVTFEDELEEKILTALGGDYLILDEVVRIVGGTSSEVLAKITLMEIRGLVKSLGGGKYKKAI